MLTVRISYSFQGVMCHHLHFCHEKSGKEFERWTSGFEEISLEAGAWLNVGLGWIQIPFF